MKTEYKYIAFILIEEKPKTKVWHCVNNRSKGILGIIKWYGAWRQYCYFTVGETVFNDGCLKDIVHFLNQVNEDKKL